MKRSVFLLFLFLQISFAFSQTAKSVIGEAAKKSSVDDSIAYLKKTVAQIQSQSEKRIVYTFLGEVLEHVGLYADAQKAYATAAGFQGAAGTDPSLPYKSSEQLVVDAVRCALCAGDYTSADSYLNSSVRNSKDAGIIAHVKLYEQWSALCKAKNESDTKEAVALLKAYSDLDSMSSVKASVLLTLWHLTGDAVYSDRLKKAFPNSMEASIVKGEVQILPTPFWYFVPRSGVDLPDIKNEDIATSSEAAPVAPEPAPKKESAPEKSNKSSSEKIVRQQLGLFKDKVNAQALVDKVKAKGFDAKITSELRPSGTTYYIVIVDENKDGTIGKELKTAGFECYPVFD